MKRSRRLFNQFNDNQSGAVSIDMVVVMALISGLGLATTGLMRGGLIKQSSAVSGELTNLQSVVSGGGSWFDRFGQTSNATAGSGSSQSAAQSAAATSTSKAKKKSKSDIGGSQEKSKKTKKSSSEKETKKSDKKKKSEKGKKKSDE